MVNGPALIHRSLSPSSMNTETRAWMMPMVEESSSSFPDPLRVY